MLSTMDDHFWGFFFRENLNYGSMLGHSITLGIIESHLFGHLNILTKIRNSYSFTLIFIFLCPKLRKISRYKSFLNSHILSREIKFKKKLSSLKQTMDNLNQDEVAFFFMLAMCLLLRWQSSVTSSVAFSHILPNETILSRVSAFITGNFHGKRFSNFRLTMNSIMFYNITTAKFDVQTL